LKFPNNHLHDNTFTSSTTSVFFKREMLTSAPGN
jgi:hypothetical protein